VVMSNGGIHQELLELIGL